MSFKDVGGGNCRDCWTVQLGWTRATGAIDGRTINRFVDRGMPFTVKGIEVGKGAALVGVGLYRPLSDSTSLHLDYQGQFGDRIRDHAVQVQFRKVF